MAVAAQRYFNKSVDQLTLGESALLASFIQSPGYYPLHLDKAEVRRNYVLTRMQQLGYITSAQENDGKKNKPTLNLTPLPSTCLPNGAITAQNNWGYFCDYLRIWAQQQPSLGATPDERWSAIRTGGYTIKLSLDPDMQAAAQHSVDNVGGGRGADLTQGVVFIEPGTGRIRSLAVNRTFDQAPKGAAGRALKQYNENPLLTGDPENQTTSTGYPSGSTFKMFTMLAALRQGMQLDTGFYSGQTYTTKAKGDDGEPYTVANANSNGSMNGYRDMWSGFGESVNTYFIQLEIAAKVTNVAKARARRRHLVLPRRDRHEQLRLDHQGWRQPRPSLADVRSGFGHLAALHGECVRDSGRRGEILRADAHPVGAGPGRQDPQPGRSELQAGLQQGRRRRGHRRGALPGRPVRPGRPLRLGHRWLCRQRGGSPDGRQDRFDAGQPPGVVRRLRPAAGRSVVLHRH
nr:penicillin-binding transpeptidase domain-containing protein [Fodinicola feengrottensis]